MHTSVPVPVRCLWECERGCVWVWVVPARSAVSVTGSRAAFSRAGKGFSCGLSWHWVLPPMQGVGSRSQPAEGWVHPSFTGPILHLPLGGLPGGGVLYLLGVSEGGWLTEKAGTGEPHGSSGEQEGEGSHFDQGIVRKGRLPHPSLGQMPLTCGTSGKKEGRAREGCWGS